MRSGTPRPVNTDAPAMGERSRGARMEPGRPGSGEPKQNSPADAVSTTSSLDEGLNLVGSGRNGPFPIESR